jgi:hypothetical protein
LRFARKPRRVLESPTANSYGVSIIHYGGVT